MNELALFAGAGGGILGGHLLGWRTVCAVEWEPYPASVLCARQNDGLLPPFPIWDDVQTFDGKPWRGVVDVVSGGFPCQDISAAGKGAGIDGKRSGMWHHMARVVGEVRPRFVFVENSPMLVTRGLERVLSDLTALGYDAKWTVMGAADVGANHKRERIWILATNTDLQSSLAKQECKHQRPKEFDGNSGRKMGAFDAEKNVSIFNNAGAKWREQQSESGNSDGHLANSTQLFGDGGNNNTRVSLERETQSEFGNDCWSEDVAFTESKGLERRKNRGNIQQTKSGFGEGGWTVKEYWCTEPNVGRVADGVAARMDRLKAIGNGQVPLCAATAWKLLTA